MTALAERLGVPTDELERVGLLKSHALSHPTELFQAAFKVAKERPAEGQILLAAAILSKAQNTPAGRVSAALSLLSPLVARADPMMTLGPKGAEIRSEIMPAGWEETTSSWNKLRYAWREGMHELLNIRPEDSSAVRALDEVTRLNPAEPEPVAVHIQEQFPAPALAFFISALGLALSMRTVVREVRTAKKKR